MTRPSLYDRTISCLLWMMGFAIVAPFLLIFMAGDWMFGWLTRDEPRPLDGER